MWYIAALMVVFWSMQVINVLFFKYGSTAAPRFVPGFILGNTFGVASTWLWMLMLKGKYGTATIMGLGTGGAFLFGQIALALVFRGYFNWLHGVGIGAVLVGMLCLCVGETLKPAAASEVASATDVSGATTVAGASGSDEAMHNRSNPPSASLPAPVAGAPLPPQAAAPAIAPHAPSAPRPAPAPPP